MIFCLFASFSCEEIKLDIPDEGILETKSGSIASVAEQISSIQKSLELLKQTEKELRKYIEELQEANKASAAEIDNLKKLQEELEGKISSTESSINEAKDWASRTFATLEQYNALSKTLAELSSVVESLKNQASDIETVINNKIAESNSSMKSWINEQLTAYCTIAQAEAALEIMKTSMTEKDEALKTEIESLKNELKLTAERLTEDYKAAIKEALENNGGNITRSVGLDEINQKVDNEVNKINVKILDLESRISDLENKLTALLNRVQSVQTLAYTPDYVFAINKPYPFAKTGTFRINYSVSPKKLVSDLAANTEMLSMRILEFKREVIEEIPGRLTDYPVNSIPYKQYNLEIVKCTANADMGTISLDVATESLQEEFFLNSHHSAYWSYEDSFNNSLQLIISDGITEIQSDALGVVGHYSDCKRIGSWDEDALKNQYFVEKGGTFNITSGQLGSEILAVSMDSDLLYNYEKWCVPTLNPENGILSFEVKENNKNFNREEGTTVFTKEKSYSFNVGQYKETPQIELQQSAYEVSKWGNYVYIYVVSDIDVEATSDSDWAEIYSIYNYDGESEVIVNVGEMPDDVQSRTANVTITNALGAKAIVNIVQK